MLDAIILIGIALTTLKIIDLLILPHQQKAIQDEFEKITLEVADADLIEISSNLSSESAARIFTVITYFEFILVIVINVFFQAATKSFLPELEKLPNIANLQFIGTIISFITLSVAWRWPVPQILSIVLTKGTWRSIFVRFLLMLFVGYLFISIYIFYVLTPISASFNCEVFLDFECKFVFWGHLLIWPVFVVFWILIQSVGLMLQIKIPPVRWFAGFTLFLARHTLWRISLYNKGALAAVVAIMTFSLSLMKIFS